MIWRPRKLPTRQVQAMRTAASVLRVRVSLARPYAARRYRRPRKPTDETGGPRLMPDDTGSADFRPNWRRVRPTKWANLAAQAARPETRTRRYFHVPARQRSRS